VLLAGLLVNSLLGWSWADPIAALAIAAVAVREGVSAWKGDTCCAAPVVGPEASEKPGRDAHDCDCHQGRPRHYRSE
jgi:hypothetical protein